MSLDAPVMQGDDLYNALDYILCKYEDLEYPPEYDQASEDLLDIFKSYTKEVEMMVSDLMTFMERNGRYNG